MTEHRHWPRSQVGVRRDDLGALIDAGVGFDRQERDQLATVRPDELGAALRASADEILPLRDRPAEPEVVRRHGSVRLLADDRIALLGPEHMRASVPYGVMSRSRPTAMTDCQSANPVAVGTLIS